MVIAVIFEKVGKVFEPDRSSPWMVTHAMNPTPVLIGEGPLVKVYFAGRDHLNRSNPGWVILDIEDNFKIVDVATKPILPLGRLGAFDDNGVAPISFIESGGTRFFYYVGFKPGGTTRVDLNGGLATAASNSDEFKRFSEAPILERTKINPFMNTGPFVLKDDDILRMYYVAGLEWIHRDLPVYNIQYAESADGYTWIRNGVVSLDFIGQEVALARPWVIKDSGKYLMWYSYKGGKSTDNYYQIGCAESFDGITFHRIADGGLQTSEDGWDSDMVEYGAVVSYKSKKFMFYNGNHYGVDGFGAAVEI